MVAANGWDPGPLERVRGHELIRAMRGPNADQSFHRAELVRVTEERGQAGAAVDPGLDADAVARWLTMLTWRGRRHLVRGADHAEIARLAGAHAALVWKVLYVRAGLTRRDR